MARCSSIAGVSRRIEQRPEPPCGQCRIKRLPGSPCNFQHWNWQIRARLDDASIQFELAYSDLEGSVQQAHIHIGQAGVNGGVMIYLCSNLPNPPLGTPPCPQSGTVTGTRMTGDVIGPAGQGIAAGEFAEVLQAIRSGNTYANVHTSKHTGGEIRGKVGPI